MKKILFLLLAVSPVVLPAEEMKFVTTLSQPVGSFARVEAVNADRPARALQVNFCNNKVSSGSMNLNGAVRAAYLKLDGPTASLGGNVPVYQLKTLNLGSGKDFQGGNVWAQEANPSELAVTNTLYAGDMNFLVAELPALEIAGTANIKSGGPSGQTLEWSAQYACDYAEISTEDEEGDWVKDGAAVVVVNPDVNINSCDEKLNAQWSWDGKNQPYTDSSGDDYCDDVYLVSRMTQIGSDLCNKGWEPCPKKWSSDMLSYLNDAKGGSWDEWDNYWQSPSYVLNDVYWKQEIYNFGGWDSPYGKNDASWYGCELTQIEPNVENCDYWSIMFTGVYKKQRWKRERKQGEKTVECKKADAYDSYLLKSK